MLWQILQKGNNLIHSDHCDPNVALLKGILKSHIFVQQIYMYRYMHFNIVELMALHRLKVIVTLWGNFGLAVVRQLCTPLIYYYAC